MTSHHATMTRTHAAKRLLEHGPLTFADFLRITGWRKSIANNALGRLRRWGVCRLVNLGGRRHHALADGAVCDGCGVGYEDQR